MTREEVVLTTEQKTTLDCLLAEYKQACADADAAEAKKKSVNSMIKMMLDEYGITNYRDESGYGVKMSKTPKIKWDMDGLLKYCKGLDIAGLIAVKEEVDMEVLEGAVYNHRVAPSDLKQFQTSIDEVVKLTTSQKKVLNE